MSKDWSIDQAEEVWLANQMQDVDGRAAIAGLLNSLGLLVGPIGEEGIVAQTVAYEYFFYAMAVNEAGTLLMLSEHFNREKQVKIDNDQRRGGEQA